MDDQKRRAIYLEKIAIYKEVGGLLKEFATEFIGEFVRGKLEYVEEVEINEDNVNVIYQLKPHCGSCYSDYRENVTFPVEYLWNSSWKEIEKEKRALKQARIEAEKEKTEGQKRIDEFARRRELYATLKNEFGD